MVLDPRELLKPWAREAAPADPAPLAGNRGQRFQRVQIGLFGLGAMILLVALADIVSQRALDTEAVTVPEAAPTVKATETQGPRDPLADAGVVPERPEEVQQTQTRPTPQERGDVAPAQ